MNKRKCAALAMVSVFVMNEEWMSDGYCQAGGTYTNPYDTWTRTEAAVLRAGSRYSDGRVQTAIADPDLFYNPADGRLHLYYQTGLAQYYGADNPQTVIRHGVSTDNGITWTLDPGIALTTSANPGAWDAQWTETPSVIYDPSAPSDRRYKMYYSGAKELHPLGFPRYSIGVAISSDGVNFRRLPSAESPYREEGAVLRVREALPNIAGMTDGTVADPEVKRIGGLYHLWFSSFANDSQLRPLAFGISHAISTDGINWLAIPSNPVPSLRNGANGGQQPSVEWNPQTNRWEMWFTSDKEQERAAIPSTFNPAYGFWRATSPDGYQWSIDYYRPRDFYWTPSSPNEAYGLLTGAEAVVIGGSRYLFYTGWGYVGVPNSFVVPTQSGYYPAVLNLLRASRPAGN